MLAGFNTRQSGGDIGCQVQEIIAVDDPDPVSFDIPIDIKNFLQLPEDIPNITESTLVVRFSQGKGDLEMMLPIEIINRRRGCQQDRTVKSGFFHFPDHPKQTKIGTADVLTVMMYV
jgi:hypothetical protein